MRYQRLKNLLVALAGSVTLLGQSACAEISLFGANFPTQFDNVKVVSDVPFGGLDDQKLDIYVPPTPFQKPADVIVFFYGGRWEYGDRDAYRFVAVAFAKQGFIVVVPDYRKYPEVRFPVFIQDGAKAVAWVYNNIASYGGNPSRIHLAGHSAGAHIAALIVANPAYLKAEGLDRSKVVYDFAGLAGPYAFTPDEDDLRAIFGPPGEYPQMQVPTFIDGKQPPMLLMEGDADTAVNMSNLDELHDAIKQRGGCVQKIIYPGVTHVSIVGALSWYNPDDIPVLNDVTTYFRMDHHQGCPETK